MNRTIWLVALLSALLPGCSNPEDVDCGLSVKPREVGGDERVSALTDAFLSQHPTLNATLHKPGISGGTGSPIACDEGLQTMTALRELGGTTRTYSEYARETLIEYGGRTYVVGHYPSAA